MLKDDLGTEVEVKSIERKILFKGVKALLEAWNFPDAEAREGARIEAPAVAPSRDPSPAGLVRSVLIAGHGFEPWIYGL